MASRLLLAFVLLLTVSMASVAQRQASPPVPPDMSRPVGPEEDEAHAKAERDMAKKANHERQVALQRDTTRLLELATQLKENVDKSTENTLSMDVIKKAEEIEKLAHSVKEKMKGN